MRAIVSVGTGIRVAQGHLEPPTVVGQDYAEMLDRMTASFAGERIIAFRNCLPPGCPTLHEKGSAFKAYAILEATRQGAEVILWLDTSILKLRPLEPLWELIEEQGYWFSFNPGFNCGQATCDASLGPLGLTREEAFSIRQTTGAAWGLDLRKPIARAFFEEYFRLAQLPQAAPFCGPWENYNGWVSADKRVLFCRNEQTVASVLTYRAGMVLTVPPKYLALDKDTISDESVLLIERKIRT